MTAKEKLDNYINSLPEHYRAANLVFAYYAAFPSVFSPDLLYQFWFYLQDYKQNDKIENLSMVVVSDLLQSGLCQEIAYELFELDEEVAFFIKSDDCKSLFSKYQVELLYDKKDCASLTSEYAERYYRNSNKQNLYGLYYWKSIFELNPAEATKEIKEILKDNKETKVNNKNARIFRQIADYQAQSQNSNNGDINKLPTFSFTQKSLNSIDIEDEVVVREIAKVIGVDKSISIPKFIFPIPKIEKLTKISADGLDLEAIRNLFLNNQHINIEIDKTSKVQFLVTFINKFENEFKHIIYLNSENDFLSLLSHYKIKSEPIINYETLDSLHLELKKLISPKIVLINITNTYYSNFDLKYIFEDFLILTTSNRHFIDANQSISYTHVLNNKIFIIKGITSTIRNIEGSNDVEEIRVENCNLTELKIKKNKNLKTIIIENSDIESIDFGEIPNTFIIKNCRINSIYTRNVSHLKTFIFVNSFNDNFKGTIADYFNLEELILDGEFDVRVLELPLRKLKRLTINNNSYLVDIKPIRKCISLEYLDLRTNRLTNFDKEILYDLPNLQELYLSGNDLGSPFDTFDNCLPNIKEWLDKNKKPQEILELENKLGVEFFELKDKQLHDCEYKLNLNNQIVYLYLTNSKIKNFKDLVKFEHLEELILDFNEIVDLSPLKKLKKLRAISLNMNEIEVFDFAILDELPNLELLYLYGNPIENISLLGEPGENCLPQLKEWNNKDKLSWIKGKTTQEILLELDKRMATDENLKPLQILYLEKQLNFELKETKDESKIIAPNLRESGYYVCNENGQVTHLNLLGFELKDLSFLADFKDLEVLNLSDNKISNIDEIGQLTKLRILNLENNRIEDIEPISKLYDLEELYLSGNQVSSSFFLMTLKNLRVIELQNNKIFEIYLLTGIEPKITSHFLYLDKLDILKLYNNPICKMNLVVFEHENCAKTLEEYEQSNDWIVDYYIYEVDYNYEFIKRGLDKIFAKSIEYRNLIAHNNLEKLKQFIEKHRQEIESYYKIKVDVKVKIKGIEEPFILDLIHSNSYERNMGNEEQYEATILMNIGSKGKDEIKISFYEYPVGVANYVSVDNKYGHLVESTNDVLLNQFQHWLNSYNKEGDSNFESITFAKPEEALTYFAENPNTDRKEEIISFLSEYFDFFAKKMENEVIQKIYDKNALAIDSINISIEKIKDITRYVFDNILIIQGSIIVDVEYSPTESNIDNIEDYPSSFNFDFAITLEQDSNKSWKIVKQPGYVEQITILDKYDDDDYDEDIIDFKTPTEALDYFLENPKTDRKEEIIAAILADTFFLSNLLEPLTHAEVGTIIIVGDYSLGDLVIEEITSIEYDAEVILLSGKGFVEVENFFDKIVRVKSISEYNFEYNIKLNKDIFNKWKVKLGGKVKINLPKPELTFTTDQSYKYLGNKRWQWSVWIEGSEMELDLVESVTYHLHSSFKDPLKTIKNRKTKFLLKSEGWGMFTIKIDILLKNGEKVELSHYLELDYPQFDADNAKKLLAENKIDAVFVMMNDYLSQIDDKQLQITSNLLQAEFNLLKRNETINSFSNQELNLKINQFNTRLLGLINLITNDKNTVFQESLENQTILKTKIVSFNSGGFMVEYLGKKAFLPISQVVDKEILNPNSIGQELEIIVSSFDNKRNNFIVSNKLAIEQRKLELKKATFENLEIGQIIEGKVKAFKRFGAFITIDEGLDGLLHINEMAWENVTKPEQILNIGETIEVQIIGLDKEKLHVSLNLKSLEEDVNKNKKLNVIFDKNKAKQLISENNIDAIFSLLAEYDENGFKIDNSAVAYLKLQYNDLNRQEFLGNINSQKATSERNNLNIRLLTLIESLN